VAASPLIRARLLSLIWLQLDLAVFAVRTPDGALPFVSAAEDRDLDRLAVVAQLLNTPITGVDAIPEDFRAEIIRAWAAH
jgi:hypothetical protein